MKFHRTAFRAEGGDAEEAQEILGVPGLQGTRLTQREALILRFCRQLALDANAVTDQQIDELKSEGLTDAEIVEIIEAMSFTTAHTKIVDALAIEADPWLE